MGSVSKCQHQKKREGEKKIVIVEVKFTHNKCNCTLLPFYNIVALKFLLFFSRNSPVPSPTLL